MKSYYSNNTSLVSCFMLVFTLCFIFFIAACDSPPPQGVSCTIDSLQEGATVQIRETLSGSVKGMESKWYMFAYTRAKLPGEPYWRSERSSVIIGNKWTVDVIYGNDKTSAGTEFETVMVITSKSKMPSQVMQIADLKSSISCSQISVKR